MRSPCLLLASSVLFALAACAGKDHSADTHDTDVTVAPPGERVASDKARDMAPDVSDTTLATLTEGNRAFATDLYHQLATPGENLFFSPHSISVALAMTYAGANGTTETQMADTLHFSLAEPDTHAAFDALDLDLQSRADLPSDMYGDGFQLSIINQTWGQTGYTFEDEFLDVLAENYGAGMYLLDFASDPDGSRDAINGWVASETEDRITDLLPEGAISDATKLVLANAIYFKASWAEPFLDSATRDSDFTLLDGSVVTVPMMYGTPSVGYATGDGWTLAELPYAGGDLDMSLLVPHTGRFDEVEAELDQPFLDAAFAAASTKWIELNMPRFSLQTEADLIPPLEALGLSAPFDPELADFSGMTSSSDLFVTGVFHQAYMTVDEAGTEAAAATTVVVDEASMPDISLTVNRPFIVVIRDRPTGEILFLGRVLDPGQE